MGRRKAFSDATGRPTLQDVGRLITEGKAKNVVIMVSAEARMMIR